MWQAAPVVCDVVILGACHTHHMLGWLGRRLICLILELNN